MLSIEGSLAGGTISSTKQPISHSTPRATSIQNVMRVAHFKALTDTPLPSVTPEHVNQKNTLAPKIRQPQAGEMENPKMTVQICNAIKKSVRHLSKTLLRNGASKSF